jgi:hypothetical protein
VRNLRSHRADIQHAHAATLLDIHRRLPVDKSPTVPLGAGSEIGPGMTLADGRVIWFGATGHTANTVMCAPATDALIGRKATRNWRPHSGCVGSWTATTSSRSSRE